MGRLAIALGAILVAASCTATAAGEPSGHIRPQEPVVAILPSVASSASTGPATPVPTAPAPTSAPATPAPASPSAEPSATPAATAAGLTGILAAGKNVYETAGEVGCQECHGPGGKGGVTKLGDAAPDIRGATEVKLRGALGGGAAAMSYIKLDDAEIEAVVEYLKYLNTQP